MRSPALRPVLTLKERIDRLAATVAQLFPDTEYAGVSLLSTTPGEWLAAKMMPGGCLSVYAPTADDRRPVATVSITVGRTYVTLFAPDDIARDEWATKQGEEPPHAA